MKDKQQIEDEIFALETEISQHEYWMDRTSNPMKYKRRKRDIRITIPH